VLRFIIRRLLSYLGMLYVATSVAYLLASVSLDPRSNYMQMRPQPPESSVDKSLSFANINDKVGLLERYWTWLQNVVLHWNWGRSPRGAPVNDELWHRAAVSFKLVIVATVLAAVIGIGVGVASAIRKYRTFDRVSNAVSVFFLVVPTFVLALMVVLVTLWVQGGLNVRPFFVTGLGSGGLLDTIRHLALPTLVLTLVGYVTYHLTQRTYLLDTINADYVRTARAKGLPKNLAIRRHALRPSAIPTAMTAAISLTTTITGAVFVEQIFAIHGAGWYFIDALNRNDINGVVGVAFLGGVATCVGLMLADVVVAIIDPRIRI